MSKPSTTYFCGNGHLLEDNPAAILGEYDCLEVGEYPRCPFCKSPDVVSVLDWHEGCSAIPYLPIRQEEVERQDHRGNKHFQILNVYDVSAKIEPDIKAVLNELVCCLYNKIQCVNPHNNTVSIECVIPSDLLDRAKAIIGWDTPQADCDSDDK